MTHRKIELTERNYLGPDEAHFSELDEPETPAERLELSQSGADFESRLAAGRQALGGGQRIDIGPPSSESGANFLDEIPDSARQTYIPESALPALLDVPLSEVAGKLPNADVRWNEARQEKEYDGYSVREQSDLAARKREAKQAIYGE